MDCLRSWYNPLSRANFNIASLPSIPTKCPNPKVFICLTGTHVVVNQPFWTILMNLSLATSRKRKRGLNKSFWFHIRETLESRNRNRLDINARIHILYTEKKKWWFSGNYWFSVQFFSSQNLIPVGVFLHVVSLPVWPPVLSHRRHPTPQRLHDHRWNGPRCSLLLELVHCKL